jgi:Methyltransferase domain.
MFREANEELFGIAARYDYFPDSAEAAIDITDWPFYGDNESNEFIRGTKPGRLFVGVEVHHARCRRDRHAADSGRASGQRQEQDARVYPSDADLPTLDGSFKLVGMGRSFHWLDQERTLNEIWRLLVPGGGIALIGNSEWVRRGTQTWQDEIYRIITDYLYDVPNRTGSVTYDDPWDDKIYDFGFENVESLEIHVTRSWTADEIIGYLFSL